MHMSMLQRIEIGPSRLLALCLAMTHCIAAAVVCVAPIPMAVIAPTIAAIGASLAWTLWSRAGLRTAESVVAVELSAAAPLSYRTRGGGWASGELAGSSFVTPCLTVLNIRPADGSRVKHVLLVRDNVDAGQFRRLRVWLRWAQDGLLTQS